MGVQIYEMTLTGESYEGRRVLVAHTLVESEQVSTLPMLDAVTNHYPPRNGEAKFTPGGFALRAVSHEFDSSQIPADLTVEKIEEPVDVGTLKQYVGEAVLEAVYAEDVRPMVDPAPEPRVY